MRHSKYLVQPQFELVDDRLYLVTAAIHSGVTDVQKDKMSCFECFCLRIRKKIIMPGKFNIYIAL